MLKIYLIYLCLKMSKPALQLPVLRNHAVLALTSELLQDIYQATNYVRAIHVKMRVISHQILRNTVTFFRCHRSVALGCNFGYLEAEVDITRNSVAG